MVRPTKRRTSLCKRMMYDIQNLLYFFSSRRRHTRFDCDWSSDVCSSDLDGVENERARDPFERGLGVVVVAHARAAGGDEDVGGGVAELAGDDLDVVARDGIGRGSCRGRGEISVVARSF